MEATIEKVDAAQGDQHNVMLHLGHGKTVIFKASDEEHALRLQDCLQNCEDAAVASQT